MHHSRADMAPNPPPAVLKTFLGIVLAWVFWVIIFAAVFVALSVLDSLRGDNWLQEIFRKWFVPGLAGYISIILVKKYLPDANAKWVAIVFCAALSFVYIGLSIFLIILHGAQFEPYNSSWSQQVHMWGVAISTCIGVYIGYSKLRKS